MATREDADDDDILVDGEGYEMSRPGQERPMAQQDPPAGRPLTPTWILVSDRLPEDGQPVHVELDDSGEIRLASRGHYQSTGAWFDAQTHCPIYESITHWKPSTVDGVSRRR